MKRTALRYLVLGWFLLAGAGCAMRQPEPGTVAARVEARELLAHARTVNADLSTFKGIGNAMIRVGGNVIHARLAFMGEGRTRLRIVTLDPGGRPAISLATDGSHYYLRDHVNGRYLKRPEGDGEIRRLMPLGMDPVRLTDYLSGRIPIETHDRVERSFSADGKETVLTLTRWWRTVEVIRMDRRTGFLREVEIHPGGGHSAYRVLFEKMTTVNGFQIPFRLQVSAPDGSDTALQLAVDRFWTNVPVNPSAFVLPRP